MADQRPPSFFHILMNPSSPHLPLPLKFVTKHLRKEILEDPIIKSANGGYLWKLKMKKIDDQSYCLVDGWCNVVKDVGLLFGEFLLFRYVGSSFFLMHVYSVNGCEKILVPKIKVVDYGCIDDDDVEEDDTEFVYDDEKDDDMEEDDDVLYDDDDDDDVEDEDDIDYVYDGDEDDDVDVDGDNGDPFFIMTSSKSNRNKLRFSPDFVALARIDTRETITLENEDGSGKEMTVQSHKKSKSTSYYVAAGWKEFQRSNGISEGDKCVFKFITSQDKICLAKITKKKTLARPLPSAAESPLTEIDADDVEDDDSMDDNDAEDDNDKDEDEVVELVDEEDPFFVVTITPTHNRVLRMPADFVRSAGIDTKRTLTLRSLDGNEMAMPVQFDTQYGYHAKRYFLLKGWKDFMQGTNILEGDKCVFKFITSEDKLCLAKITKPPPAAATQVNDDDDKDENEDVELLDDVDPFFVVTISTSHKLRLGLPIDFVGLAGIDTKETIIMISLDGNECQMAVRKYTRKLFTRYHLSDGWHAFMHSNNISQGDKCVFTYITSEDKMCLAKIIKAPTKEVDADDGDPSFVVTITINHKCMLPLPPDFIALAGIDTKENIIMKSIDGNENQMAVRLDKRFNSAHYCLSLGWVAFKQSNNISQGDECVFKYITSEDKMCLVKITNASAKEVDDGMGVEDDNASAKEVDDGMGVEDDNDSDEDENVKPVDDTDPFFVVTIPSHKSMLLLPTDFVALARISIKENIIIKSLDGKETQIPLHSYKLKWSTRYCFSVGWGPFKRCNNISDGDECVFKYIKSEDKMCLSKITKKITRATLLPIDNDDMGNEDVVEKGKGEDAKLVDEDDDNDNEEADYDGDDGDPSFILNISKVEQYKLYMPADFVRSAGIDTKKSLTLLGLNGYEKEMPLRYDKKGESKRYYYVAKGWPEFRQNNAILEGDKCVFKFITSDDKLCLATISKKKTPTSPLPPAATDDDDDDDDDEDDNEDVERVDDEDPFFVATINHKFMLRLPSDFVRSAGIDTKKSLTLLGFDGYEKELPVRYDKKGESKRYYYVAKGWPEFRQNNAILEGDKCVFKFITSDDKLCLATISKKKTPTSPLPPATTDDDDEDDNEDIERVDDEDPFFVATINHKFILRLPSDFVALAKIDTKENIIIRSLDGNERQIPLQSYKQYRLTRYHFSIGWLSFRRSNNISEGDECVFKYIRCEDKMCLVKVTKRKTQARSSRPAAVATETEVDADDAEDDDGLDDNDAEDDNDKDEDEDDDPFFVVTITQHNFKGGLRMPVDFVRSAGIDAKKTITLKSLDGYEKKMPVQFDTIYHYPAKHYYLMKGWTNFARSNNILVGDKCVFKFITSEDKMCLAKVTKTKTQTSLSSPAKVVKKKKRGRPAKVVKRKKGQPSNTTMAENVKITVEEVVKRKRGRPPASPRATKDVKRKKGWEPRGHSADVEGVDKCVELGKRPRGRPAKRLCGKAPQQK